MFSQNANTFAIQTQESFWGNIKVDVTHLIFVFYKRCNMFFYALQFVPLHPDTRAGNAAPQAS